MFLLLPLLLLLGCADRETALRQGRWEYWGRRIQVRVRVRARLQTPPFRCCVHRGRRRVRDYSFSTSLRAEMWDGLGRGWMVRRGNPLCRSHRVDSPRCPFQRRGELFVGRRGR